MYLHKECLYFLHIIQHLLYLSISYTSYQRSPMLFSRPELYHWCFEPLGFEIELLGASRLRCTFSSLLSLEPRFLIGSSSVRSTLVCLMDRCPRCLHPRWSGKMLKMWGLHPPQCLFKLVLSERLETSIFQSQFRANY